MTEIQLGAGTTAVATITKYLTYRVTNEGWTLKVESTKPIAVRPNADGSISIISVGNVEDDEV